jgi:hypothetical protein
MDPEYLRQEGKLAVNKLELEKQKLRIFRLRDSVRDCLDPTEDDPAKIRSDMAADGAVELDTVRTSYLALLAETEEIKRYLGRR